jgi:hypothetical protein
VGVRLRPDLASEAQRETNQKRCRRARSFLVPKVIE